MCFVLVVSCVCVVLYAFACVLLLSLCVGGRTEGHIQTQDKIPIGNGSQVTTAREVDRVVFVCVPFPIGTLSGSINSMRVVERACRRAASSGALLTENADVTAAPMARARTRNFIVMRG